jgi:hypothetical protein
VYSLALTAVRCLTGRLPPAVGLAVLPQTDPANPTGLMDLPEVADWPADVTATLRKGLAYKADARYPSVEALAADFARAVCQWEPADPAIREPWEGRLGSAPAPTGKESDTTVLLPGAGQSVTPAGRSRRPLFVAGGVAILAAAGAVAFALRPQQPDPVATLPPPAVAAVPTVPNDTGPTLPDTTPPSGPERRDPAPAVFVVRDSLRLLEQLTDPPRMDTQSARRGVALHQRLQARLDTPKSRVAGRFYAARALIHLGNEAQACAALRAAAPEASGTPFAEAVRTLLDAGC